MKTTRQAIALNKSKSVNSVSWRTWSLAFGIWLIPFLLIPLSLPEHVINGICFAGFGLVVGTSLPSVVVFKHQFSGAFVGAVGWGFVGGLGSVLFDFAKSFFGL